MKCETFQINNNLLIGQQNNNSLTKESLYLSFTSKKSDSLFYKGFSKHARFTTYSLFWTVLRSEILNKCRLPTKSAKKYFYSGNLAPLLNVTKIALPCCRNIWEYPLLLHFYWVRCAIFQINTDLLTNQQNINIFIEDILYSWFFFKKKWRSSSQRFSKTSSFNRFCNILNEYRLSNKSGKF